MSTFLSSFGGRVMSATTGVAIAAVGALAVAGLDPLAAYASAVIPLLLIGGSIFGVGLSLEEHPRTALALVLGLPLVAGPYLALLIVAPALGAPVGALLLALSGLPFAVALRGVRAEAARRRLSGVVAVRASHP
jgi:hypothetical protein